MKKNKKNATYVIISIFLILGILAAVNYATGGSLLSFSTYGGCSVKSGLSIIPLVGYYKCEQQAKAPCDIIDIPDILWYQSPGMEFTTACNVFSPACEYTLMHTDGQIISSLGPIVHGKSITVKMDSVLTGQRQLKRCYSPYALVRYSPTSEPERVYGQSTYSCALPSTSNLLTSIPLFREGLVASINPKTSLYFGETAAFLDKWVVGPVEYNFDSNKGTYCSAGGYIYPAQTISLQSGCYLAPNLNEVPTKVIGCIGEPCTVSGHLGTVDSNYACKVSAECDILRPCTGWGKYVIDYSDPSRKTAMTPQCIDGKCLYTKVTSECVSDNACPGGQLCDFNTMTGIGRCISSTTVTIPPRPGDEVADTTNWFSIAVSSLVALMVFFTQGENAIRKRDYVGLAVPAILAISSFMAVAWIIKNIYAIIATSILGTLFGGALLYFFGGAILAIVGTVVGIWRIIRGGSR